MEAYGAAEDRAGSVKMTGLSLFSGIGGLDLAAQMCGIETTAFCEIEPFTIAVLKKRFPGIPILPDIRKVNGFDYCRTVDVIFGGFPCQDLSLAGRRAGLIDADGNVTRSGLWYEMLRIIAEARPRYVVAENVRGAVNAALDAVKEGLEGENYKVWPVLIPASAVGAPHQRERLFILGIRGDIADMCTERISGGGTVFCASDVGDPNSEMPQGRRESRVLREAQIESGLAGSLHNAVWRTPDANMTRGAISEEKYVERAQRGMPNVLNYQAAHVERAQGAAPSGQLNPDWVEELMGYPRGWTDLDRDEPGIWMGWPARPGEPQYPYEHPRTVVGMKNRAKRLKALGNAVVPQQAEPIFRTIQFIDYMISEK